MIHVLGFLLFNQLIKQVIDLTTIKKKNFANTYATIKPPRLTNNKLFSNFLRKYIIYYTRFNHVKICVVFRLDELKIIF